MLLYSLNLFDTWQILTRLIILYQTGGESKRSRCSLSGIVHHDSSDKGMKQHVTRRYMMSDLPLPSALDLDRLEPFHDSFPLISLFPLPLPPVCPQFLPCP